MNSLGRWFAVIMGVACVGVFAEEHQVASAEELRSLKGTSNPGDVVILANGTYTDTTWVFEGVGTKEQPITLRAENPGKVILEGSSTLYIAGEHLVVDGLFFRKGMVGDGESIIHFRDTEGVPSRNCILRNTVIEAYETEGAESKTFWVSLFGSGHVVENCSFSGHAHPGVTLVVRLAGEHPGHHLIRRNHFFDRPEGDGNGWETIRIGTGAFREVDAHVTIEDNLFEDCNGEIEIISTKSNDNAVIGNTFRRCVGSITLRQGHRTRILDNVFDGEGVEGTRGLRVTGDDNVIQGNHFMNLKSKKGAVMFLYSGPPGGVRGGYAQVRDTVIHKNVFTNNQSRLFEYDGKWKSDSGSELPEEVIISNNLFRIHEDVAENISKGEVREGGITWVKNYVIKQPYLNKLPEGFTFAPEDGEWQDWTPPVALTAKDVGPEWMK